MASRSLGVLTLDLVARIGGFEAGMDKAARTTDKRMREMERRAKKFGTFIGTAVAAGATAAFVGLAALTKSAINNADAMRDLSIRVGVSTEVLSAYGYAASQTGTDIDALSKGLKILAKNAADAINPTSEQAKVFDALGIKVTDANGKLKDLSQLVPEIADKFKTLEDGTTKAALAQALFGKSGLELTEFLNQGSQGLDEFAQKAASLGIIIDTQTAAAADNFNDTLGDLKAAVSGLGLNIAKELLPTLVKTADGLIALIKNGNLAADVASVMGAAFSTAAGILSGYEKAVRVTTAAIEAYVNAAAGYAEVLRNIYSFGFANGSVTGGIGKIGAAFRNGDKELQDIHNPKQQKVKLIFAGQDPDPSGLFKTDAGAKDSDLERRLGLALSNPTIPKGTSAIRDRAKATQEATAADKAWAEQLEDMQALQDYAADAQRDYTNDQLQAANAREDAIEANRKAADGMLDDMKFELSLVGLTNKEREKEIALRYAGADATEEQRAAIADLSDALYEANERAAYFDDLKSSLSDMFIDFVSGAKSAKEAFGDFADYLFQRSLQLVADNLLDGLFSGGNSSGGGGGGLLSGLLSLFSGGGFGGEGSPLAAGGPTIPGMYHQVGEFNRPEMYYEGGKQYLIPGDKGRVVPMGGGGGYSPTMNFLLPQRIDNRSQMQIAQAAARGGMEATRRNGR